MVKDDLQQIEADPRKGNALKFIIGGIVIVAAIIYLMVSSLQANIQYFLTVDEAIEKQLAGELTGRNIRLAGAVLGESIQHDMETLELSFSIVHVPGDIELVDEEGGLAAALHNAVMDPTRSQLKVVYYGARPDLLQNEAQAILTGEFIAEGVFEADELLLKCPTKYEGSVPDQIES